MDLQDLIIRILNSKWFSLLWGIIFSICIPLTFKGMSDGYKPLAIAVFLMNIIGAILAIFKFISKLGKKEIPKNQEWD